LRWRNFHEEFEERYYSWEHRREKEHEFLDLRQRDLTVLEYKRRFQDLAAFSSTYLPTERHKVERFRDGLRQELRMILISHAVSVCAGIGTGCLGYREGNKGYPKASVRADSSNWS
jgi:hypothetical protein